MSHSTPGLPVNHHLPEFTQTHVHQVSDAIQAPPPLVKPIQIWRSYFGENWQMDFSTLLKSNRFLLGIFNGSSRVPLYGTQPSSAKGA